MKTNSISLSLPLAITALLAAIPQPGFAQSVLVTGSMTDVAGPDGVFDYTLTVDNVGTEAVQSLWIGWIPGSFNIVNPSNPGNLQAWTSAVFSSSLQYGGTVATALAPGQSGIFTFDSTITPAEFEAQTGKAGQSTAYGVNATTEGGQLSFTLSGADTDLFGLSVVPEPSILSLLAVGAAGLAGVQLRRKMI